jgi:hypothetical protein
VSDGYSRIFLLSHMRAFTSLAGHILGSHPQITGYYEMHLSYEDAQAPARQLALLAVTDGLKPGSRYVFDKLLHDDCRLLPERLGVADTKILVSLREPGQTIRSIVSLFRKKGPGEPYAAPAAAARYYVERLGTLAAFCEARPGGYWYYDAQTLTGAPDRLLPALTRWLALDAPLDERYETFSRTGLARSGDSSSAIRSGRISPAPSDYADVALPPELLDDARTVYRDCRRRILNLAIESLTDGPATQKS